MRGRFNEIKAMCSRDVCTRYRVMGISNRTVGDIDVDNLFRSTIEVRVVGNRVVGSSKVGNQFPISIKASPRIAGNMGVGNMDVGCQFESAIKAMVVGNRVVGDRDVG